MLRSAHFNYRRAIAIAAGIAASAGRLGPAGSAPGRRRMVADLHVHPARAVQAAHRRARPGAIEAAPRTAFIHRQGQRYGPNEAEASAFWIACSAG